MIRRLADDEALEVALRRLDEAALRIASSRALRRNEAERHALIASLTAVHVALRTLQVQATPRRRQSLGRRVA